MMITFPQQYTIECLDKRVTGTAASDTPTSVVANKLVDTGADFSNVTVGDYVVLAADPRKYAQVTALDSGTQLSLADDIILGTDYKYYIVPEATAFQLNVDIDNYDGETVPNFKLFLVAGDNVESEAAGGDLEYTVSGCEIVSIDSATQCTVSLPLGNNQTFLFNPTKKILAVGVDDIDFILIQEVDGGGEDELVLAGSFGKKGSGYAKIGLNGQAGDSPVGLSNGSLLMSDVLEAIVGSVSGGWQNTPAVNIRALGGGRLAHG